MAVAGQDDRLDARLFHRLVQTLATGRITVPAVQVERQAQLEQLDRGLDLGLDIGRQAGDHLRHLGGRQHLFDVRPLDPRHDHLVAQDLPRTTGALGLAHGLAQPAALTLAQQVARRLLTLGLEGGDVRAAVGGLGDVGEVHLFGAGRQTGFDHVQAGQIAEVEAAVDRFLHGAGLGLADRHPFVIGAKGRRLARGEVAFGRRLMVLGPHHPDVVGDLVVVPDADEGGAGVGGLQIGIGLVLGVARPIVGQADDFVGRQGRPVQRRARRHAVVARRRAVFVDVVAQVNDGVQPVQLRDGLIGVEQAARIELARHHGQVDLRRRALGQGADPTRRRGHAIGDEAIEILPTRLQAATVQVVLDGEVALGPGGQVGKATHHVGEVGVPGHFKNHRNLPDRRIGRGDAGPEDRGMLIRIAAGHPVKEGDLTGMGGLGDGGRRRPRADQSQKAAAIQIHRSILRVSV